MSWTQALPYFPGHELACKGTGEILLDLNFAVALPMLRKEWGSALFPTSVCRTPGYNLRVRGHPRSLHLTKNPKWPTEGCMAADIAWGNWHVSQRLSFAELAWDMGWSVGLNELFCHIDRRLDLNLRELPQDVFLYTNWQGAFSASDVYED